MEGIPPARASDNEDVMWALETAESLWKRNARVDAIVWVRRASEEAAESGDKERAAALAASAAALTEAVAATTSATFRSSAPASLPPAAEGQDIDALLATGDYPVDSIEVLDDGDLISLAPSTPIPTGEPSAREPAPPPSWVDVEGITRMGDGALSAMDLAGIEAFATLSDDQRERMVRAATVILCTSGVTLPDFGFALVLEGEITVAVSDGGSVITRIGQDSIVRTRGTQDVPTAARFTASAEGTSLALWTETKLSTTLNDAPRVLESLRTEGDRLQAWAEVARSSMASLLPEEVRLSLVGRLSARALPAGGPLVLAGEKVPGILLVGIGTILIDEPNAETIGAGKFVFPAAALSASRASSTARAGDGGAVVLCADRHTTQELCVTEPLLLELLASAC